MPDDVSVSGGSSHDSTDSEDFATESEDESESEREEEEFEWT